MEDGIIELDTPRGAAFNFTSDRYDGWLWKQGDDIMISFIVSRRRGNFRKLVEAIWARGFTVKVPTPSARMRDILSRNGFRETIEMDPAMGPCEVWVCEPPRGATP